MKRFLSYMITLCPGGPGIPKPGSPAIPFSPFSPSVPLNPGWPGVPKSPLVPFGPIEPVQRQTSFSYLKEHFPKCKLCNSCVIIPGNPISPRLPFCPGGPMLPGSPGKPESPFSPVEVKILFEWKSKVLKHGCFLSSRPLVYHSNTWLSW